MKKLLLLALLVAAMAAPASAGTVTFHSGLYQSGSGGEFTFETSGALDLSAYKPFYTANAKTSYPIGSVWYQPSFQTFCLEENEYIADGTTYNYTIGDSAVLGGNGGPADPISNGTAWLYAQFASGTLKNYAYTGTAAARKSSAAELQNAIWFLEGEGGLNNSYVALVTGILGAQVTNDANGAYGVKALNLTNAISCGGGTKGGNCQSQLYYVPDGGVTLMMLGGALVGIGALRRKFRK
jgi:hypothetical protein